MADTDSDIPKVPGPPVESPKPRRAHTYSRLTTAIAVLALATSVYTLLRLDATRDRLDGVNDSARTLQADRKVLRAEIGNLANEQRKAASELDRRLDALDEIPKQVQDLASSVAELRGRAEGPERAWSRAEAMFLLELAQRRLALDRDLQTAIVALESADSRLAALRDQSFAPVRQQIAHELQELRAVHQPDTIGILARLAGAEEQVFDVPVKGITAVGSERFDRNALPQGMFARAWSMARNTLANLIVVRKVDDRAGGVVTAEEALLRRQHLQLLLFSARTAVARHDATAYRSALARAREWLGEFFDLSSPSAQALLKEVQALEPLEIDPPLPDISGSLRALRGLMPGSHAAQ